MIVFGDHNAGRLIADKVFTRYDPATDTNIANISDEGLLGGVVFTRYTGTSIEMHIASVSKQWVTRDALWSAFHYPFEIKGVKKIIAQVRSSNRAALDFDTKLGFKEETRILDVYPDGDKIFLTLTKPDCWALNMRPPKVSIF